MQIVGPPIQGHPKANAFQQNAPPRPLGVAAVLTCSVLWLGLLMTWIDSLRPVPTAARATTGRLDSLYRHVGTQTNASGRKHADAHYTPHQAPAWQGYWASSAGACFQWVMIMSKPCIMCLRAACKATVQSSRIRMWQGTSCPQINAPPAKTAELHCALGNKANTYLAAAVVRQAAREGADWASIVEQQMAGDKS